MRDAANACKALELAVVGGTAFEDSEALYYLAGQAVGHVAAIKERLYPNDGLPWGQADT